MDPFAQAILVLLAAGALTLVAAWAVSKFDPR
jgi:hypothetical protein